MYKINKVTTVGDVTTTLIQDATAADPTFNSVSGAVVLNDGTTTIDGEIAFDRTNEDLSIGDGTATQLVHMGAWKTWTPVYTGFSTAPTPTAARYTMTGKMVTARLSSNNGTSNATTFTVTLPVVAHSTAKQHLVATIATDNGTTMSAPGYVRTNVGSAVADIFVDVSGTAWTASGGKKIQFVITYETD